MYAKTGQKWMYLGSNLRDPELTTNSVYEVVGFDYAHSRITLRCVDSGQVTYSWDLYNGDTRVWQLVEDDDTKKDKVHKSKYKWENVNECAVMDQEFVDRCVEEINADEGCPPDGLAMRECGDTVVLRIMEGGHVTFLRLQKVQRLYGTVQKTVVFD